VPGVDLARPSIARVYDFALGGKDNFRPDRDLFERIMQVYPEYQDFAQANRGFMVQAVRRMADAGVDQFLDLGTGIPTSPNVHEVARDLHPEASVVYVDHDPVVMAHARALLARHDGVAAIHADITRPDDVLTSPEFAATLDLSRPVGLLCTAVMHFVPVARALAAMARYRQVLAPGSHVAISTFLVDPTRMGGEAGAKVDAVQSALTNGMVFRTRAQIDDLFTGWDTLWPGLQDVAQWSLGGQRRKRLWCLAGIGRLQGG
jgi:trans-aconitate methyltransferase